MKAIKEKEERDKEIASIHDLSNIRKLADERARGDDPRFRTFGSGEEFVLYLEALAPGLNLRNVHNPNDPLKYYVEYLGQLSKYFIEFRGLLNDELYGSNDYAILCKGTPYTSSNTFSNIVEDINKVEDVNTLYKDSSVDSKADSSLTQRFGITSKDLSLANHIIFIQKDNKGDTKISFSKVVKYETDKIGILPQEDFTPENLKELKDISPNTDPIFFVTKPVYFMDAMYGADRV